MPQFPLHLDADCLTRTMGGVGKSTWYLYNALGQLENNPLQAFGVRPPFQPYQTAMPAALVDTPLPAPLPIRDIWRATSLALFAQRPDVKLLHFPNNGRIPFGVPAHKCITTLHDVLALEIEGYLSPQKRERYRQKTQRYIDESRLLLTVSDYSRQQIERHFTVRQPIHVLPNAATLPPRPQARALSLEETGPYFIYTGRYEERKGIHHAVAAFLALHERGETQSQLWLTGKPHHYSESFSRLLEAAKARDVVRELGYVSDEALATLLHESRGLVYPSASEGFGLPPLEAMMQGCPVITTRKTAIPEACGDAVLYVAPTDIAAFQAAILQLDTDAALRASLIEKGYAQAEKFSWQRSAERFLTLLEKTLVIL